MKNLRVVIDTNVFLVIIPRNSAYRWIFDLLLEDKITLLLSSDIILEYEEQLKFRYHLDFSDSLLDIFSTKKNIELIRPSYQWNLVVADPDDNKFVDCAVAGNADIIISNDSDLRVLEKISFPAVKVATVQAFENFYKEYKAE